MKSSILFLAALIFVLKAKAQCDSTFFRYTGTRVNDVSLLDSNKMIGVGDYGHIIKSTDGGRSWKEVQAQQMDVVLKAIQMVSNDTGYTVGTWKTILKTEDQGETWFPLISNTPPGSANATASLNDLYFVNEKGFIVGNNGTLLSTTNGGRSWKDTIFNSSDWLNSVTFVDSSVGFICGSSTALYKTIDGGNTWQKIILSFLNSSQMFTKVRFIDSRTGFVIGDNGLCIKTTDGGETWRKITVQGYPLKDIYFQSPTNGFIVGANAIFLTSDRGETWESLYNYDGRWASYNSVNADPLHQKVIIAGGGSPANNLDKGRNILSTINFGQSYTSLSRNGNAGFSDVCFINDSTGYIIDAEGSALKTSDYAESWKPLQQAPATQNGDYSPKIFFLDSLNGFATSDVLYKTSNGGKTWIKLTTPGTQVQYLTRRIHFFNTLVGLVQDMGTIYKTTSGGATWTRVASHFLFGSLAATPNGKVFAVGYGGHLIVSTNQGTTWDTLSLNTSSYFTNVYFYNDQLGFISTNDGKLFKTTDAGTNWQIIYTGNPNFSIGSLLFHNELVGYMIGSGGIYKTTDGALTWFQVRQENGGLSKLAGFKTIYSAGANGTIYRTSKLKPPVIPGYIYGPEKACVNQQSGFITGSFPGVSYTWSLTGGGANAYNANTDTVVWNTPGLHTLSVTASNACGISPARQISIHVISFEPQITVHDSVLTATEGFTYQWYRNGDIIHAFEGGTSRNLIPRVSGSYTVAVTSTHGCTVTTEAVTVVVPVIVSLCPNGNASIYFYPYFSSYQWQRDDGSGFVNIADDDFYTGTDSSVLQLTNIPSSWYGYTFRCITDYGNSDVYTLQFINNWTGAVNEAWENPQNWSCGKLPDANTDVFIDTGTSVINSNVVIRKLTINPAVNLTVLPGNALTITH